MKIVYQGKTKSEKEIIIRYLESDDVVEMTGYINELSKEKTFITFQGEEISLDDEKKYIDEFLKKIDKKTGIKLLAIHDSKIIGISDIFLAERTASHVGIFGLTVASEFRNQGIGKLLMDLVIKEAEKEMPNLKIITLGVFSKNSIAKRIYEGFGFVEYGKLPKGIMRNNDFEDEVLMYKNIK